MEVIERSQFSIILNPIYYAVTDLVVELEALTFKFGMSLLESEQSKIVKGKISELEKRLSDTLSSIEGEKKHHEQQLKDMLVKNRRLEDDNKKIITKKDEMKIILSELEAKHQGIEKDERRLESNVYEIQSTINQLNYEKNGLEREIVDIREEIRIIQNSISLQQEQGSIGKGFRFLFISGTVVGAVATVASLGAAAPLLAVAGATAGATASAGAITTQICIDNINKSIKEYECEREVRVNKLERTKSRLMSEESQLKFRESQLRDQRLQLDNTSMRISKIKEECSSAEREIAQFEIHIARQKYEIRKLEDKMKQISELSVNLKQILLYVTGIHDVALVVKTDSQFCLKLNNLVRNLGKFEILASNPQNAFKFSSCPTNSVEFCKMRERLEEFKKKAIISGKRSLK
ncbi:hypothetical protein LOD99_15715 [Oopsacas minuta]|uniref:Uncharacterized protein n=1 Tax=Oopsacas minuta TaxID=111878 RepID=A0AAV7KBB2_9METZ|nr:hypothetical protein LOD99_15715 [Oopsacas minuta]